MGVAIWENVRRPPKAAFYKTPWLLRKLWVRQNARSGPGRDIFEIEAIGPLIILGLWPELLAGALWLHFIDNAAAQAALVRGSSSVRSGDALVGRT